MSEQGTPKWIRGRAWSDSELAFIFCQIDVCKAKDVDPKSSLLTELEKFSGRKISYLASIEIRLRKTLREWGMASLSMDELWAEGSAYLESVPGVPESVRVELERMRANEERDQGSIDGDTGEGSGGNEANLTLDDQTSTDIYVPEQRPNKKPHNTPREHTNESGFIESDHSATLRIEDTPEPPTIELATDAQERVTSMSTSTMLAPEQSSGRLNTGLSRLRFRRAPSPVRPSMSGPFTPTKRKALPPPVALPTKNSKTSDRSNPIASSSLSQVVPPLRSNITPDELQQGKEGEGELQSQIDTLRMQVDILLGTLRDVTGRMLDEGAAFDKATSTRLKRLFDDAKEPSTFNARQQDDLQAASRKLERLRKWQQQLVKGADADWNVDFPELPDFEFIEMVWQRLLTKLRLAIDVEDEGLEQLPSAESAGYLTARMEDILTDRLTSSELEDVVEEVKEHVQSPFAVLALTGALFCRDLFRSPEPMCTSATPDLMVVYEMQRTTRDITAVQHSDMIVSKILFDQPEHKAKDEKRAANMLNALNQTLQIARPDLDAFESLKLHKPWVVDAVQMKKTLMISPEDYRIRISKVGSTFDPAWMIGVAKDGRTDDSRNTGSRKVALCLFPAVFSQERKPLRDDATITDALVSHRKFLPTSRERSAFSSQRCVAKATVLLISENYIRAHD